MLPITAENTSAFEKLCNNIINKQNAAGTAVAIFNRNADILYENFFGYRNKEEKLEINENTIFGLASITKSFVTLCILKLCNEGSISLEDPVSKYCPYFTGKNMKGTLKIKHLLSHSGGFFPLYRTVINDIANEMGLSEKEEGDFVFSEKIAEYGCKKVAEQMDSQTEFIGLPDEIMSYCNDGFGILSDIIRRVGSENSFAEYVNKNILLPLGMTRSCVDYILPQNDPNSSLLYTTKNGKTVCHHDYHDNAFVLNGAGAMKSTISDMIKYISVYLNNGKSSQGIEIVTPYYLAEMLKPRQYYSPDSYYCYGLMTKKLAEYNVFEHSGGLPGVSSNMAFLPDAGIGVIVLCNTDGVSAGTICDAAIKLALGMKPAIHHHSFPQIFWSDEFKSKICGSYIANEGDSFTLSVVKHDTILTINGSKIKITPIFPNTAIIKKQFSDIFLQIMQNKVDEVWGARYGSRVFKKTN